jgi:deoxyribodipyrimidine photo-lyase
MIKKERINDLTPDRKLGGNVIYWMSREQRVADNPGLLHAKDLADKLNCSLAVVFTLTDNFLGAVYRQYDFMLRGLHEVGISLQEKNIPFYLLTGDPPKLISSFAGDHHIGTIVFDFDPLRIKRQWHEEVIRNSRCKMIEVDGHNIVPARFVSDKLEYGAYTLRPKIHKRLGVFLEALPELKKMKQQVSLPALFSHESVLNKLQLDRTIQPVGWILPGEKEAMKALEDFTDKRLPEYKAFRNDPNRKVVSKLSPYLHFGQISSLRIALEVLNKHGKDENSETFLEELIVRKELSDNFCHYNPDYDNEEGFHDWAKKTHREHARDEREYSYSTGQFEQAKTHDPLWNAAQMEMVKSGTMHGYMRMYWAKKILEWTEDIGQAMEVAIYLNDRYQLDGRDPNGYTGIAWSIGGVHDRAWTERPVFGKIRYMNYNGCKRKFDVDEYIRGVEALK